MNPTVRVLFVCLGNICRSPMAEAVMRSLIAERGMSDEVKIDSCGTASYHVGDPAHDGTLAELEANGIDGSYLRARALADADAIDFTHILALDRSNLEDIRDRFPDADNVSLLMDYADSYPEVDEVPDPYFEGRFDYVFNLITDACNGFVDSVCTEVQ